MWRDGVHAAKAAMDAAGNALVVWRRDDGATNHTVETARYSPVQGTWSPPHSLSVQQATDGPVVAMDAAGNGIVLWGTSSGVQSAHYAAATDSWGAPVGWATTVSAVSRLGLVMDLAGDAVAIFTLSGIVHASHYPHVAVDRSGNAFVTWLWATAAEERIKAIRYSAEGDSWGSVITLATGPRLGHDGAPIAVDAAGNAIALWGGTDILVFTSALQSARYVAATGAWSPAANVPGGPITWWGNPSIGFDAGANAVALWTQIFSAGITRPRATRWVAGTPEAPTMTRHMLHAVILLAALPAFAAAQRVETFAELPLRLNVGDTVTVYEVDGTRVRGLFVRMAPEMLVLRTGDADVTLAADRVRRVGTCCDRLLNGPLIGFAAGGIFGVLVVRDFSDRPTAGEGLQGAAVFGDWVPGSAWGSTR